MNVCRALGGFAVAILAAPILAAPVAERHEIKWFVHTDLVSGGADLPFYEAMLDAALEDALLLLEGDQGPADSVCCQKLDKKEHSPGATLQTFGAPGDGLDLVDGDDFETIRGLGGSGSRGFIVDSILNCGGSAAIGCADLPACNSSYDDDPDQILVVTLDAEDQDVLGIVLAHERGHNACLAHATTHECQLMQGAVAGGCLQASECSSYGTARQTTGGSCVCHAGSSQGTPEANGTGCSDGAITGSCSGGVCGEVPGHAGVELVACGAPGNAGGATDDPIRISALTGGWEDVADFGVTLKALDYDPDADVLYGIQEAAGDDLLVTLDRTSWSVLTSNALAGYDDVISLAFDPGPTPGSGDDRLLALDSDGTFETLIEIDPATAAVTEIEGLSVGGPGNFTGLAYDSTRQRLYASGAFGSGLYEIDESSCGNPDFCDTSAVAGLSVARLDSSLSYSAATDALYVAGRASYVGGREVSFHDVIDAATLTAGTSLGVDDYTPSGLAVPEPRGAAGLVAGAALLAGLRLRAPIGRRSRSGAASDR